MTENPFADGQQFSSAILNSMYNAHALDGVLAGLDVVTGTNAWEIDVSNGTIFLNNSEVDVTGTTLTHSSSDVEDRIDLIVADTTGLSIVTGDPASTAGQPIAPDIPTDSVLVALIYIRGASSEILSGDIFDDYKINLEYLPQAFLEGIDHSFLSGVEPNQHHTRPTSTQGFSDSLDYTGSTSYTVDAFVTEATGTWYNSDTQESQPGCITFETPIGFSNDFCFNIGSEQTETHSVSLGIAFPCETVSLGAGSGFVEPQDLEVRTIESANHTHNI